MPPLCNCAIMCVTALGANLSCNQFIGVHLARARTCKRCLPACSHAPNTKHTAIIIISTPACVVGAVVLAHVFHTFRVLPSFRWLRNTSPGSEASRKARHKARRAVPSQPSTSDRLHSSKHCCVRPCQVYVVGLPQVHKNGRPGRGPGECMVSLWWMACRSQALEAKHIHSRCCNDRHSIPCVPGHLEEGGAPSVPCKAYPLPALVPQLP